MNKRHLTLSLLAAVLAAAPLARAQAPAAQTETPAQGQTAPRKPGRHPHVRRARRALEAAKRQLEQAAQDYGGHRAKALELVNQAIAEVDQALEYAKANAGKK